MTPVHDISMTILTFWRHFTSVFRQTFRRQRIGEEPYRTSLDRKNSYFSVKSVKQHIFSPKCNCRKKSMQENKSVMVVRFELKIPSLGITVRHHSASLVMPNSYPRDEIFSPNLTTMKDSYRQLYICECALMAYIPGTLGISTRTQNNAYLSFWYFYVKIEICL